MKRLSLSKSLTPREAENGALVGRTKRMMRQSLIAAANKQGGKVKPAAIRTFEYVEYVGDAECHVISMRLDIP